MIATRTVFAAACMVVVCTATSMAWFYPPDFNEQPTVPRAAIIERVGSTQVVDGDDYSHARDRVVCGSPVQISVKYINREVGWGFMQEDWFPTHSMKIEYAPGLPYPPAVLLLDFDGEDGSTNVVDLSTNQATLSKYGSAAISSSNSFSGSGYWQGGAGSRIETQDSTAMEPGTNDWSVEAWVTLTTNSDICVFTKGSHVTGFQDTGYAPTIAIGFFAPRSPDMPAILKNPPFGSNYNTNYPTLFGSVTMATGERKYVFAYLSGDMGAYTTYAGNHSLTGEWHHVALSRQGQQLLLWRDGMGGGVYAPPYSVATLDIGTGALTNNSATWKLCEGGADTRYDRIRYVNGVTVYKGDFSHISDSTPGFFPSTVPFGGAPMAATNILSGWTTIKEVAHDYPVNSNVDGAHFGLVTWTPPAPGWYIIRMAVETDTGYYPRSFYWPSMLAGWYMDDKGEFSYWENEQVVSVYVTSNRIPGSVLTSE